MKLASTVQYRGTNYHGFQIQPNAPSIQEELEKALQTITRSSVKVHPAGRTDTGVHAYAMVVHFELPVDFVPSDMQQFFYSLNCVLPKDITFIHFKEMPKDFHARYSCVARSYVYQILTSPYKMVEYEDTTYWYRKTLNIEALKKAVVYLIGEHDFAAFTKETYAKNEETTIRRIDNIQVIEESPLVLLFFQGSGFLHNMIRIITGCLVDIASGLLKPDDLKRILESKDRKQAGRTMPAKGLFFLYAQYQDYQTPRELVPRYRIIQ